MSTGRALLTFSISSCVVLSALESEFGCHPEVSVGTGFDGDTFILAVECSDTAMAVWEVRATVLTFDPDSMLCRQASAQAGISTAEGVSVVVSAEPA